MATWVSFEEIEAWQLARQYCKSVHQMIQNTDLGGNYKLKDQLYSSCGSIMDNIAEGFERGNNKEFIFFLAIAKGSAGESRSQLYRAFDFGYIDEEARDMHMSMAKHISGKIYNLIEYLKVSDLRGTRYK